MNRDAKPHPELLALARARRTQRALAHAYLHRDAPMPTLRLSLGFMTSTACTTEDGAAPGHTMTVLGVSPAEGVAYVVEELGGGEAPIAYRLWLRGSRQGHMVPIRAWYEHGADPAEIRARLAAIATSLELPPPTTPEAWMLSTRVVQRRALRVPGQPSPIRKFALQLRVEPVSGFGASGQTTVTAFLRPHATLEEIWTVPDASGAALARVRYIGIPSGLGQPKDTIVLLTE